jgi:hypothetical protein
LGNQTQGQQRSGEQGEREISFTHTQDRIYETAFVDNVENVFLDQHI